MLINELIILRWLESKLGWASCKSHGHVRTLPLSANKLGLNFLFVAQELKDSDKRKTVRQLPAILARLRRAYRQSKCRRIEKDFFKAPNKEWFELLVIQLCGQARKNFLNKLRPASFYNLKVS